MTIVQFTRAGLSSNPKELASDKSSGRDQVPDYIDSTYLMVINNKVYDVQEFVNSHPGGRVILTHVNGKDATEVFRAFHPESAYEILANYYVGDIVEQDRREHTDDFTKEINIYRKKFEEQGLFKSNKLYYLFKVLSNYLLLGLSIVLLQNASYRLVMVLASAISLGFFWQQSGWLAHDFLHQQVFRSENTRWINNAMGYLLGNLGQGFSVAWWKNKHNTHHAVPNIDEMDPDIDTMPIIAWSTHSLKYLTSDKDFISRFGRFMVSNQDKLYFLVLSVARLSWCQQSLEYVFYESKRKADCVNVGDSSADSPSKVGDFAFLSPADLFLERITLLIHWALYLCFGWSYLQQSPTYFLLWILVSQASCGYLLAAVFSLNHNGMPVLDQDEFYGSTKKSANAKRELGFYEIQVLTGRDVQAGLFNDWFTGGLNYQIEHHLFPLLPRHNFHLVKPKIRELCNKLGVEYHETRSIWDGLSEIVTRLKEVGNSVVTGEYLKLQSGTNGKFLQKSKDI